MFVHELQSIEEKSRAISRKRQTHLRFRALRGQHELGSTRKSLAKLSEAVTLKNLALTSASAEPGGGET